MPGWRLVNQNVIYNEISYWCINTMFIWFERYCFKCSTIPCENIPPSVFLGDDNLNNIHMSKDSWTSCQLVLPFIINKHIQPFGICNPKYQCYFNSVIQTLLSNIKLCASFHQVNICEFKLELQSRNNKIGFWPLWPWPLNSDFNLFHGHHF